MSRILIVDDEQDVVDFFADELQFVGYKTDQAADGVEAVLKFVGGGISAVLMDIRMPKLDGVNALRIMKRINPAVPVILFTGQAGQGDMYEATRLGAYTCLLKPVAPEKLVDLLKQTLKISP